MKLARLSDDCSEYVIKCRGITLTEDVGSLLTFSYFRQRVLSYRQKYPPMQVPQKLIKGNLIKEGEVGNIYTLHSSKKWEPLITKGMVLSHYEVVPFGYFDIANKKHEENLHQYEINTNV